MNGIVIVKGALYTLSGMGTKAIVHTVLKPYIPVDVNAIQKIAYTAAEFGLAGCAAAKTGEFWVKSVDEMIAIKDLIGKKIEEARIQVEVNQEELKKLKKETKEEKKEAKKKSKKVSKKKDNIIEVEFEETNEEA